MMTKYEDLKMVVQENDADVYCLTAEMIKLEVVQYAVAQLMESIDEIKHNKWNEDPGMARLSIDEVERKVRLIDMAFYPLFKTIKETVDKVGIHSKELFDMVARSENNNDEKKDADIEIVNS